MYTYPYIFSLGKDKGDSLKNAAVDFEGTEVHVYIKSEILVFLDHLC